VQTRSKTTESHRGRRGSSLLWGALRDSAPKRSTAFRTPWDASGGSRLSPLRKTTASWDRLTAGGNKTPYSHRWNWEPGMVPIMSRFLWIRIKNTDSTRTLPVLKMRIVANPCFQDLSELQLPNRRREKRMVLMAAGDIQRNLSIRRMDLI